MYLVLIKFDFFKEKKLLQFYILQAFNLTVWK